MSSVPSQALAFFHQGLHRPLLLLLLLLHEIIRHLGVVFSLLCHLGSGVLQLGMLIPLLLGGLGVLILLLVVSKLVHGAGQPLCLLLLPRLLPLPKTFLSQPAAITA